jgi:hypothetical protein
MACAWLIRRFVDAAAKFQFVPAGHQPPPDDAEPFDIPGARLSHHGGHCTLHALLREYQLSDPVLQRIARIVDEADTVQEVALESAAPGLDLLCRGLRRISPDDHVALERGALLYEALYAQLASEEQPSVTTGTRPHGDSEPNTDPPLPPLQFGPQREQDSELPDHDALDRWEDEGGTPPSDTSAGPSASC